MTRWNDAALGEAGLVPPARRVPIPRGPQDVASVLDAPLRDAPESEALVGRGVRYTYRQLDAAVNAAVAALRALGVEAGARVAACAPNHPDLVIAFLAVQRLGAIWLGVNRNYAPPEKAWLLSDAGASLFLADAATLESVKGSVAARLVAIDPGAEWQRTLAKQAGASRAMAEIDPWAPAAIAYTSGTTGRPKGAVHSQHNMMVAASAGVLASGFSGGDARIGSALPLTILNMLIREALAALSVGGTHVCMDRIDAEGVADWVRRERIVSFAMVPTVVRDLLTRPDIDPASLASLRSLVVGAAAVPPELPSLYEARFGQKMKIAYGLTENPTGVASTHDASPSGPGVIGRPYPHLEVAILDADGRECPVDAVGEICVRATRVGEWADVYTPTLGYWGRAEASAELLRGGWMHTGDLGRRDASGELYIEGRRGEVIIRGGANVYPAEVERVIGAVEGVSACAVIGRPDERLGEVVVAFIEPLPGVSGDDLAPVLQSACAAQLARYKIPSEWRFVEALPRNAMNKIAKASLKALLG